MVADYQGCKHQGGVIRRSREGPAERAINPDALTLLACDRFGVKMSRATHFFGTAGLP